MKQKKELIKAVAFALLVAFVALAAIKLVAHLFPDLVTQVQSVAGQYGLFGTFVVVLLGSTLVPFSVDVYFLAALEVFTEPTQLLLVAVAGSFIGGMVNYYLASFLSKAWVEKQIGKTNLNTAHGWFDKWGGAALLVFGVLPLSAVFDPLTFIAGLSRMNLHKFALYLLVSRVGHFAVLVLLSTKVGL